MSTIESEKIETGIGVECVPEERTYVLLIVDDEKLVRMVLKRRLAALNLHVLEAENGKKALEILQRESVDVIVSDWMMPELDGLGLCKAVKENVQFQSIHLILMTALSQPEQLAEGLNAGADDFLLKSSTDQEILARIGGGLRARKLRLDLEASYRVILEKQGQLESSVVFS